MQKAYTRETQFLRAYMIRGTIAIGKFGLIAINRTCRLPKVPKGARAGNRGQVTVGIGGSGNRDFDRHHERDHGITFPRVLGNLILHETGAGREYRVWVLSVRCVLLPLLSLLAPCLRM